VLEETVDVFPELTTTADDDLERLLRAAEEEADTISVRRRALHARIDALRHERVERIRAQAASGTLEVHAPTALERPIFEGTGELPDDHDDETTDVGELSDDELREQIVELEREEDDISLRRRMLHGRVDMLRAERERRRRGLHIDPDELGPILGGNRR
jgi:FKBP-type peptidyl-prolyl cis-trans isomerase (trigger factor)